MPVLIAAVVVVGALCLTDLLLTFGVIRRLREHTELLTQHHRGIDLPVLELAEGERPGLFSAVSTDGEPVSGTEGLRIAAFFSPTCSICPVRVPVFIEYLRTHGVPREAALVVISGSAAEPPSYLNDLTQVARVSVEDDDGALAAAFKVTGFPAFCLLDAAGTVIASSFDPLALPQPVAA